MKKKAKYTSIVIIFIVIAYLLPSFVSPYVFDIVFINSYAFSIVIGMFILAAIVWIKIDQLIDAIKSIKNEVK